MALDLSPVLQTEMMMNRLELQDDVFPVLQWNDDVNGWVTLLTLDTAIYHWDMRQVAVYNYNYNTERPYIILRIMEDEDGRVKSAIPSVGAVSYGDVRYKVSKVFPPFGIVRIWAMRLDIMEDI